MDAARQDDQYPKRPYCPIWTIVLVTIQFLGIARRIGSTLDASLEHAPSHTLDFSERILPDSGKSPLYYPPPPPPLLIRVSILNIGM